MSEHTIKLPAKALNTSNVIVLDANGDSLLEMSISQQGARTKVIQALNGHGVLGVHLQRLCDAVTQCAPTDDIVSLAQSGHEALRLTGANND